jgi:hypothetical protein
VYSIEKYTGLKCNRFLRERVNSVVFYLIRAVHKFDSTSIIKRLVLYYIYVLSMQASPRATAPRHMLSRPDLYS